VKHPHLILLLASVAQLGPSSANAGDNATHYAVNDQTMVRERGKIRAVQVHETRNEKECLASVTEFKKAEPLPYLEGQPKIACFKSLPADLAAIHSRSPVPGAFHIQVESGNLQRFVAGELVTHNLFFYTFDPGPPPAVCERLSKQFGSAWVTVKCTPPRDA
jgi:hypothetical protein